MKKNRILMVLLVMLVAVFTFAACECAHVYENGVCTECGEADPEYCEHKYAEGVCTKCGEADPDYVAPCAHAWVNGKCTKCEEKCTHTWKNGVCSNCSLECVHIWGNGTCTKCDYECTHESWESGACKECKKSCDHSWQDGACLNCGYACSHSWREDSICNICLASCQHRWEDGGCVDCKATCDHSWENGTCTVCAFVCAHATYENGACKVCGTVCEHAEYENGACKVCGTVCEHAEYENGACKVCGTVCEHAEYENGACKVCGTVCEHAEYENGACKVCGTVCEHAEYENGACKECGTVCEHTEYENGACKECGTVCEHAEYENGACKVCGTVCSHETYEEGVCTVCGADDPNYVPADGGKSLYNDIIERYQSLVLYVLVNETLPEAPAEPAYYEDALRFAASNYVPSTTDMGYAYKDINGDGYFELILMSNKNNIFVLFTIKDKAPVVLKTFSEGLGYLDKNGVVFSAEKTYVEGTTSQIGVDYRFERLVDGELYCYLAFGWDDADGVYETADDEIYYKLEDGVNTVIDYDAYKVFRDHTYEYYVSNPTRMTKLSGIQYTPALADEVTEKPVADFSTYEAIIETIKTAYAVNSKFDKSKWLKYEYDNLLSFKSTEDFEMYNRIVAAAGFITSSSSSAKLGYVIKDLNGDGIDELLLVDTYGTGTSAKMGLFAIFTLVDNKPVLLDTYIDIRFACIDANGNIVVCDRPIIPSNGKKDRDFIIYTIENGALKVTAQYGYKCEQTNTGKKFEWYKIENGESVTIDEAAFEEWYEANVADGATASIANFSKYTAKVSGLEFVQFVIE